MSNGEMTSPKKKSVWTWIRDIIGFIVGLPVVCMAAAGIPMIVQAGFDFANFRHWMTLAMFLLPGVCAFLGFILSFFERSRFSQKTGSIQIVIGILSIISVSIGVLYDRSHGYQMFDGSNSQETLYIVLVILAMTILPMIFVILSGLCAIRNAKRN